MSVTGLPPYDPSNIFARILRGEIPCKKIHEDAYALAFPTIRQKPAISASEALAVKSALET